MREMSEKNKEILAVILSGISKPREIAEAYGVEINTIYKLTHNHREKIKRAEARARKLREADKRKAEAKVKKKAISISNKVHPWERRMASPQHDWYSEELQSIAVQARKMHAAAAKPPAKGPSKAPEDYFERLKMAQAEIDRLVEESVKQKNVIDELTHQNKTLMRVLYRIGHL
ncbi:hypothetical protein UFOVP661_40 [uncultured Caudovirales phage]|uniref:Uncharacterized protein n=1 Tax=uncultured Caudovirales phage TaxID=2100421 RepID=A0A6J5NH71_9CAUD|nr:hypothetical protein UFOVP661_40 [uncultured Caudovirales phage]